LLEFRQSYISIHRNPVRNVQSAVSRVLRTALLSVIRANVQLRPPMILPLKLAKHVVPTAIRVIATALICVMLGNARLVLLMSKVSSHVPLVVSPVQCATQMVPHSVMDKVHVVLRPSLIPQQEPANRVIPTASHVQQREPVNAI